MQMTQAKSAVRRGVGVNWETRLSSWSNESFSQVALGEGKTHGSTTLRRCLRIVIDCTASALRLLSTETMRYMTKRAKPGTTYLFTIKKGPYLLCGNFKRSYRSVAGHESGLTHEAKFLRIPNRGTSLDELAPLMTKLERATTLGWPSTLINIL